MGSEERSSKTACARVCVFLKVGGKAEEEEERERARLKKERERGAAAAAGFGDFDTSIFLDLRLCAARAAFEGCMKPGCELMLLDLNGKQNRAAREREREGRTLCSLELGSDQK